MNSNLTIEESKLMLQKIENAPFVLGMKSLVTTTSDVAGFTGECN